MQKTLECYTWCSFLNFFSTDVGGCKLLCLFIYFFLCAEVVWPSNQASSAKKHDILPISWISFQACCFSLQSKISLICDNCDPFCLSVFKEWNGNLITSYTSTALLVLCYNKKVLGLNLLVCWGLSVLRLNETPFGCLCPLHVIQNWLIDVHLSNLGLWQAGNLLQGLPQTQTAWSPSLIDLEIQQPYGNHQSKGKNGNSLTCWWVIAVIVSVKFAKSPSFRECLS